MFDDRADAGRRLAARLMHYYGRSDAVVLGLPRGGVAVAYQIALALHLSLGVLPVRKLGVPGQPELAMGAIASGGVRILDHSLIAQLGITDEEVAGTIAQEEEELRRRERLYGVHPSEAQYNGMSVIVVDDGIATGSTMLAAVRLLRSQQPARIIVAVPVAPPQARQEIEEVAEEFVCLRTSEYFPAVGSFYRDFSQVKDEEVSRLLALAAQAYRERSPGRPQ